MGFALPAAITGAAVRSYRTISPLPNQENPARRYIFCGTFRKTRFERVPPAVSRHVALWRPDFPPVNPAYARRTSGCPSARSAPIIAYPKGGR